MRVENEMGGQARVGLRERRVLREILVDQGKHVLGGERIGDVLEDRYEQLGVRLALLLENGELLRVRVLIKALQQSQFILRYKRRAAEVLPLNCLGQHLRRIAWRRRWPNKARVRMRLARHGSTDRTNRNVSAHGNAGRSRRGGAGMIVPTRRGLRSGP